MQNYIRSIISHFSRYNFVSFKVFLLSSIYVFLLGFETISVKVSLSIQLVVTSFFVLIVISQLLICFILYYFHHSPRFSDLMWSFFLAINSVACYLSFFGILLSRPFWLKITMFLLFWLVLFGLFYLTKTFSKFRTGFFLTVIVSIFVNFGISYNIAPKNVDKANLPSLVSYKTIVLKEKPNVHLIGIDSMIPASLAKKFLNINSVPYVELLESKGAISFNNLFASAVPTRASWSSIVRLADENFDKTKLGYFAGKYLGPLYFIFRNNGYKIASGYNSKKHFGPKGPYVDDYIRESMDLLEKNDSIYQSDICRYQGMRSEEVLQLFGICKFARAINNKAVKNSWPVSVFKRIGEKGKSEESWLTLHHIYRPIGHTWKGYRHEKESDRKSFRDYYKEGSNNLTKLLPKLIGEIRDNDPRAIVFLFGDHGTYTSRGINCEDDPDFCVQDKYGIYGALLKTENKCASFQVNHYRENGYSTIERVIAGIIRCLASNPEAVDQAVNFKESHSYKNYLYE
jgi:hypothetical protein